MMMSRPSDNGHTPFGDIYVSQSPDLEFWGRHRYMMGTIKGNDSAWQSTKVGAGPAPIETDEGWLLIYHGVLHLLQRLLCTARAAALLDLDEPWKVLYRSKDYLSWRPWRAVRARGRRAQRGLPLRGADRRVPRAASPFTTAARTP